MPILEKARVLNMTEPLLAYPFYYPVEFILITGCFFVAITDLFFVRRFAAFERLLLPLSGGFCSLLIANIGTIKVANAGIASDVLVRLKESLLISSYAVGLVFLVFVAEVVACLLRKKDVREFGSR